MSWQRGHSDRFGSDNRGPSDRYGGGGNRGYSNRGHGDNRGYGNPRIRPEAAGTHQYSDDYAEEISIFGGYAEEADDGGWHTPPRNFAYPLRPAPQQRRPTGPAPERPIRGDGRGGGAYRGAPRVPYVPGNSDRIGGLPRNPRPRYDYDPSAQGPSEPETYTQPRAGQQPLRPTPQYFPADRGDPTFRPSVQSDRSIYIGFDPSAESRGNTPSSATQNAPVQGYNQQRRPVANVPPPPSSRRVAPSYYPQQTMQVSPIPEESSLSRHDSYASSAAIPTTWGPDEFYSSSSGHSDNRHPIEGEGEHGPGLVRQASVGRKTRPLLTEIKSIDRSKSRRGSASAEADLSPNTSPVVSRMASPVLQIPQTTTSPGSNPGLSPTRDHSLGPPRSPRSPNIPSPLSRPPTSTDDHPFSEKPSFYRNQSDNKQPSATAKELGILVGEDNVLGSNQRTSTFGGTQRASTMGDGQRASTSSRIPGRRLPPRLNMDAVRDAEARGSLTSLPDLIRRATKLAAVLETGRPGSSMTWGRRNSMLGPGGRGLRETGSISDMLSSFPPPGSRNANSRTMSQWFLPDDYDRGGGDNGQVRQLKNGRRICGLPLWAFIVMVIFGLVLITAAVVVPLQLVSMSKANNNNDNYFAQCKKSNPCQNGGENIATNDFCGCVCTNGFTGSTCTLKDADTSCTSFDFKDRQTASGVIQGIKNATIGSALPRLFDKGNNTYNIELDPSLLLGVFSKGNLSCTLQNALVNFTGRTQPESQSQSRFKRELGAVDRRRQILTDPSIITDPATSPTPTSGAHATPTASRNSNLDQDTVDFARVAVLYLAQTENLGTAEQAHQNLDTTFRGGTDKGNVTSSGVTFELEKRSIVLRNGTIVGGANQT